MSPSELRVPSFELARFGEAPQGDDLAELTRNDFFAGVDTALAARSARAFRVARLPARALVYERWAPSEAVFLILTGRLHLERTGPSCDVVSLGSIGPGEFCGEGSLLPGVPRVHRTNARCVEPTAIAFAEANDFAPYLDAMPAVALNLARSLQSRLATLVEGIAKAAPVVSDESCSET